MSKRGYVMRGRKNNKSFRRAYNKVRAKNAVAPSMLRGGGHC